MNAASLPPGDGRAASLVPGIALAVLVAVAAYHAEPALRGWTAGRIALPSTVIALILGILFFGPASRPQFQPGLVFCVKKLLRWAIALLGLRVALGDIADLGLSVVVIVLVSMAATVATGIWVARLCGQNEGLGALIGAACAVCGASATLATATVVPDYRGKEADIAFGVVMANTVSTVVMLLYPPLCLWLGLSEHQTGLMLGATIHDMAQVVGAGYAVSETTGNTAVIVKLFRVFLLLPTVVIIGWWLARRAKVAAVTVSQATERVPLPLFALVFLALCLLNSLMAARPVLAAAVHFAEVKSWLVLLSGWGLLIALAALGLGTSIRALLSIGWRHALGFLAATGVILTLVLAGIAALT